MPAMVMKHEEDPKDIVLRDLGDISSVEIWKNQVLCAIYERPNKTKSGLFITDSTIDEDKFQGKVALVVALGPDAFVDDDKWTFSSAAALHDWVFFRTAESTAVTVNGKMCRLVLDTDIRGRIQHPDSIW